jgi:hypothetical protein
MLDRTLHQVTTWGAGDPGRTGKEAHVLSIAATSEGLSGTGPHYRSRSRSRRDSSTVCTPSNADGLHRWVI